MIHLALFLVSTFIVAVAACFALFACFWLLVFILGTVYQAFSSLLKLILWPFWLAIRLHRHLTRR